MDLEAVAAVIRPREPYEAIDLGFGLARNFARQIWLPWLICVVPIQLLIVGVFWNFNWFLGLLLLWWIKPLFDRLPLFVLSRALFGATPKVRDVIRAFPKMLIRQLFWALTVQRLDPRRAFRLPVWELEGLPFKQRGRRLKVLDRGQETPAFVLSFLCNQMQWGIAIGLFLLVNMLIPSQMGINLVEEFGRGWPDHVPFLISALAWLCYLIADAIVSPLYVAGGFALYINRRTHLEGWDVQLAFQRLAKRLAKIEAKEPRQVASGRLGAVAILLCLSLSGVVQAQDLDSVPLGPEPTPVAAGPAGSKTQDAPPAEVLKKVYGRKEFGGKRKSQARQLNKGATSWLDDLFGGCGLSKGCGTGPPRGAGDVCMLMGSAIGAFLVVAMVAWLFRYRARLSLLLATPSEPERNEGVVVPEVLMGLDLRAESLPDDIARAAAKAQAKGDAREALSLLYRGALARLIPDLELKIDASATEGDCLAGVKKARGPAKYFARLTKQWQLVAYGHRDLDASEIEALCAEYDDAIGRRGRGRRR
ncbi:MAG: DUF4129 domain-containing protein [Planctomycetes bacterium]|nr:DUF4129 domain-containing protein [Planctomycetota bacterium]